MFTQSHDFLYLVFAPVMIAKKLGEDNKMNFPGTVMGVMVFSKILLGQYVCKMIANQVAGASEVV